MYIENSMKNFIKGLQLFKNIKNNVNLNFNCINKNLNLKQKKSLKKKMITKKMILLIKSLKR